MKIMKVNLENYANLCRGCLVTKESFSYFLSKDVTFEDYEYCTSVKIHEDVKLPTALCNTCYQLLTQFKKFKKKCVESEKTLTHVFFKDSISCEVGDIVRNDHNHDLNKTSIKLEITHIKDENIDDTVIEYESIDNINTETSSKKRKRFKADSLSGSDEKLDCTRKVIKINKRLKGHKDYTCKLCNKKFGYLERFEAHLLQHDGKSVRIHCEPCNKTFMTWSGIRRHREANHNAVRLVSLRCDICGRVCSSRESLREHRHKHTIQKTAICHVCGNQYTNARTLQTHLETHNQKKKLVTSCQHCTKKFSTNLTLQRHIFQCHNGRRFICDICNYSFTNKHNLSKHLLIHEGKKLYKCEICNKSYGRKMSLDEHKRLHSGERPYMCIFCPKSFVSKKRLKEHQRIHTGERPYKCDHCEQKFTQRGTLKRHTKIHDRREPQAKNTQDL